MNCCVTKEQNKHETKKRKTPYIIVFHAVACANDKLFVKGLILNISISWGGFRAHLFSRYSKASTSGAEELKNNWIPLMSKHVKKAFCHPHILEKPKSERNYINQIHFHYYNISEALSLRQNAVKPHLFFLILQRVADITWYSLGLHGVRVWMTSTSLKGWNYVDGSHWDD